MGKPVRAVLRGLDGSNSVWLPGGKGAATPLTYPVFHLQSMVTVWIFGNGVFMKLNELLAMRGLDITKSVKMARHQDKRYDVHELMTTGHLETYQAVQGKPIFDCKYVVSFIGQPRSRARLVGVYKVNDRTTVREANIPEEYPYRADLMRNPEAYYYHLAKEPGFEDLEERVVIDWGGSTISWHQWIKNDKEVFEIVPAGFSRTFPGYLDFILSYGELCRILNFPEANHDWHVALSSVAGVYLIVNSLDGTQYVGSAYGAGQTHEI